MKIGVILANLGTPSAPTASAISTYLNEFLRDTRVVDLPRWKWLPILKGIILPLRSQRIAKNYQAIWTEQGSPLLAYSLEQQKALQHYLFRQGVDAQVEIGMTYGEPSIESAVKKLTHSKVDKIIFLPLYPQYSSTTTAAAIDAFARALTQQREIVPFSLIHSYADNKNYIEALAESIQARLKKEEFLLFSYHGIPLRYEQMGDFYRDHCRKTTLAVVDKLGLMENQWAMTFQSRFGREEWLQPYTDQFLENAPRQGIEHIAVICPGFAVDCLETLEEIAETNRHLFLAQGGQSYQYIPALNATEKHIECLGQLILSNI